MNQSFKMSLNFNSVISISGLIGLCSGVVATPFILLNILSETGMDPIVILFTLIAPSITGLINGLFIGLVSYPLYKYLTTKYGFKYTGSIYIKD